MRDQSGNYLAVIKVVGTGGGGSNAVNRMVEAGLRGCESSSPSTRTPRRSMVEADQKIHIGAVATRGSAPAPIRRRATRPRWSRGTS